MLWSSLRARSRQWLLWTVHHAGCRRTVAALAAVSAADYLVPVLPNEGMAVTLGLLQPRRVRLVAFSFAFASAIGAVMLGLLLVGLVDGAQRLGVQTFGDEWERITAYVQRFGPVTMLLAAVFPSPPRVMVAATVLSGVPVAVVGSAVFFGKLALYALIFGAMRSLPAWAGTKRGKAAPWLRRALRVARRCLAYRRWLVRAART